MSRKLVPIHEAAEALGVSAQTLRRWEREGRLLPDERTP
ncbi:MerR family DNA-binding transcriptional regulator [Tepidimonas charontis]|nr:MerR family DNA-binding transcriptional regulator [Tepidimonas charontis]